MQLSLFSPEEEKEAELTKHTAAIHIKASLSLVDRKVLNILLKNAYDELGKVRYHTIRLAQIQKWVGWNSKNYEDLKKSLRKLVSAKIEWNIFGQDKKNQWFISSLLASASIAGGKFTYDYPFHLQELLKNPNIYGKINLLTQNNFKSKYSLILWEFLMNHISKTKSQITGTEWIKIKDYRDLMGVDDKAYSIFKEFSFNLVKTPIKEINKVSEIEVEAAYHKTKDQFDAVRFIINKKPKIEIPKENPEENNVDDLKNKLINFCKLSLVAVDKILTNHTPEQIAANIEHIKLADQKGLVKDIAAYSFNAIKNDLRTNENKKEIEKKQEPEEIKILRENLKKAFSHNQLDYDIYLNGNDIRMLKDRFLVSVSQIEDNFLKTNYSNILEKLKIILEIKK